METNIHESFTPITEKAVRSDGTIGVKIIAPGWGSSGYYGREMLERDIPKVFPVNTQMFWNHATPGEEHARPEGDLNGLAAVLTTTPMWQEGGKAGPGMYADAKVFSGYAETVDEIAPYIGVSIRGTGISDTGDIDGRTGPIIKEITMGKSVDFVTKPGAGGKIVQIFESAATSESVDDPIQEAQNLGEWLESRLHLRLTEIGDNLYGNGTVNREERKAMSAAIGAALDAYRAALMESSPQLFKRAIWHDAPDSADIPEEIEENDNTQPERQSAADNHMEEPNMDELQEAKDALAKAQADIAALNAEAVKRDAAEFVRGKLAEADLPTLTNARLTRVLALNVPLTEDGALDEAVYATATTAAIDEAKAEIAAVSGSDGRITGHGDTQTDGNQMPSLNESQKRIEEALATIGGN